MQYYPVFLDLKGRLALVVGGGAVGARKARSLAEAGARVRVVAPAVSEAIEDLARGGTVEHLAQPFEPRHLDGAAIVIAATGDRRVNARVARHARLRGLPVNVVDDPVLCSFITPAILDRSPVTIAVSTGGLSPTLARWVKTRIAETLPGSLGPVAAFLGGVRETVRRRLPDIATRRRFWDGFLDGPATELLAAGRGEDADTLLRKLLDAAEASPARGQVFLVGAGPGDPDLLTVKALRLLQRADVIVHDALVSNDILDLARRDADRIYVGKRRGDHALTQDGINALLTRLAREGKMVVRLKGGDPFVFGRGGEEMQALERDGVICHAVLGITAATGCAASAGMPLTHRDMAQSCVFVTGHGKNGPPDLDWAGLARPGQTVVIYMGLSTLAASARALIEHGLPATTPAAAIEKGTTPDERVVIGAIGDLDARVRAASLTGPALIVVGEIVGLARQRNRSAESLMLAV